MKEKIPGMQLGGPGIFPGCMSDQTENHFFRQWAAQDMIQPDFISMMEYDYVVNEPENRPADGTGMERMEEQNGFRQKKHQSFCTFGPDKTSERLDATVWI